MDPTGNTVNQPRGAAPVNCPTPLQIISVQERERYTEKSRCQCLILHFPHSSTSLSLTLNLTNAFWVRGGGVNIPFFLPQAAPKSILHVLTHSRFFIQTLERRSSPCKKMKHNCIFCTPIFLPRPSNKSWLASRWSTLTRPGSPWLALVHPDHQSGATTSRVNV